jgi:uncharacterized protein YndB with AHSA1/START domain
VDASPADREAPSAFEIRRLLPGTPEEIFAAWTEPELMQRWMSPVGHAEAEVDLRVGGRFRVVMVGEGTAIEHAGEYLEISPPRYLVFTWQSPYTGPDHSVVTVVLEPAESGTEIVLTHERLPEEMVVPHRDGWGRMLERLSLAGVADTREEGG